MCIRDRRYGNKLALPAGTPSRLQTGRLDERSNVEPLSSCICHIGAGWRRNEWLGRRRITVTMELKPRKRIGLVAHDNKKADLIEWARYNKGMLCLLYTSDAAD